MNKGEKNIDAGNQFSNNDEIDLIQLIHTFWIHKYWMICCTLSITTLGIIIAIHSSPIFTSRAIIALKESEKGAGAQSVLSNLGALGGVGGAVASQLGFGNTNLDKVEIILTGHELAESIIQKNNLMTKLFSNLWDETHQRWLVEDSNSIPSLRQGVELLSRSILTVSVNSKKKVITVQADISDSVLSKKIVDYYLEELNYKMLADVKREASINKQYLENILNNTADPILKEKIYTMVAFEIEKYMLVSSQPFEILEKAEIPYKRSKPNKKLIVITAFMLGIVLSMIAIFAKIFILNFWQKFKFLNKEHS